MMEIGESLVQPLPPMMMVNLIDHCSICLRKMKKMTSRRDTDPTTASSSRVNEGGKDEDKYNQEGYLEGEEDPVPEGRLPPEITSFQHIWSYLVGDKGRVEEVTSAKFICSGDDGAGYGGRVLVVTELPQICEACGEKVAQLDRLHRELEAKVHEIKEVIKDTGGGDGTPGWRRQGFAKLLRNSQLETRTVRDTFQYLDRLYGHGTESEWMDTTGEFDILDNLLSQPLDEADDHDDVQSRSELESDDWKLKATVVVSLAPVIPPKVETEEEDNQTRGVKRRRGPIRKAKVPFLPQEELVGFNWDQLLDHDIKQEVQDQLETNVDEVDPHLFPNHNADDDDPANSDHHDKEDKPIQTEMDIDAAPRLRPRPRKRGKARGHGGRWKPANPHRNPPKPKPSTESKIALKRSWNQTSCEICNAVITVPEMYEHVRSHVGDFVVKCPNPKCPYAFSNPRSMDQIHLRRKKKCKAAEQKAGHVCETCGVRFGNALSLRAHILLHETGSKNITCPIQGCEERFTVRQSVYEHIFLKHLSPKTAQQCNLCNKFQDVKEMEAHLKEQHQIQDPIKCRQCLYCFPDWESLLYHLSKRHGSETSIPCYICISGVTFLNMGRLQKHYFKEHQIGSQFVCDLCGKEYLSMQELQAHIRVRHDESYKAKLKTFKCDQCEEGANTAEYRTEKALVSHKIRVHGAEPFSCDVCHATFHTRQDLNWHVRDRDPQAAERGICSKPVKREYSCDVENCSAKYNSKKTLDRHKRREHGIVPPNGNRYICEFCSKEFLRSSCLLRHRNRVHLGIRVTKPCICETCGETFVSAFNLRKHMMIHTGERPHSCEICGQTFRQKEVYKVHLKSHETLGDKFKPKGAKERTKRFKRDPKPFVKAEADAHGSQ